MNEPSPALEVVSAIFRMVLRLNTTTLRATSAVVSLRTFPASRRIVKRGDTATLAYFAFTPGRIEGVICPLTYVRRSIKAIGRVSEMSLAVSQAAQG